ncbi:MAG TPA: class I SAM-dependent methyltransferase, partial [Polyangiales bacterium]|nr:class I SAM-dependent methyltransferase [Polyangiales bacterium]
PRELEDWLVHGARAAFADLDLLARAIELACARRSSLVRAHEAGETDAYRLMNGDADGVPGFSVDVYDRWLVVRVDGDERTHDERALIDVLRALGCAGIYVKRHPKQANQLVDPSSEEVAPSLPVWGEPAPDALIVHEERVPFEVRLSDGLRTGLFLDQRDNRARLRALAPNKRVLNLFGYTGSFSVAALVGDAAAVTTVDVSRTAIAWAGRNAERVGRSERHRAIADDVFDVLRRWADRRERFDFVILDPPSYSTTKRRRFRAISDYAELCAQALALLDEGGSLLACINHQGVSRAGLRRFVHEAARMSGRALVSIKDMPSGVDFPSEFGREPDMKSLLAELAPRGTLSGGEASDVGRARRRAGSQKTRR